MSTNEPPPIPPGEPGQTAPYASPHTPPPASGREQFNVIADTVVGPNLRLKDNVLQAIAIVVCLILGVFVGLIFMPSKDRAMGVAFGAIGGLLVGLFGSGIFIMIYRGIRHARGRHD